jgi:hypothetical protein
MHNEHQPVNIVTYLHIDACAVHRSCLASDLFEALSPGGDWLVQRLSTDLGYDGYL